MDRTAINATTVSSAEGAFAQPLENANIDTPKSAMAAAMFSEELQRSAYGQRRRLASGLKTRLEDMQEPPLLFGSVYKLLTNAAIDIVLDHFRLSVTRDARFA